MESRLKFLKFRAFVSGAVGIIVAFGITELVHGLYQLVPSVLVSLAQRVVELTPGQLVTQGIEMLGKADIPVLITVMLIFTVAIAGLLANLALRSWVAALAGVAVLAAVAVAAAFSKPFIAPVATVATIVGALAAGVVVTALLLRAAGLMSPAVSGASGSPGGSPSTEVRSREAHSSGGMAVGRRSFLVLGGGATVAGALAAGFGRMLAGGGTETAAQSSESGGESVAPSQVKTLPPPPPGASLEVEGMPPLITPAKDFYLIDSALSSPRIERENWSLEVKGAVDNPFEITYKDLVSMPAREADITLSCVSNKVGGGLISNGRWTGVLLSDVLKEAGMSPDKINRKSEQLVGRSVDGWTSGFKTARAFDGREALVVFGLNGEELPVKHGYPVRLVVPGLYGYISATKWLTEIELTDWDFDAYWIQRGWSKQGPIKTQSRIDTVFGDRSIPPGRTPVGGVAWAPHRGIKRVEVSTDDGESWNEARLAEQLDVDTWRQYVYEWDAEPGEHTLKVRATDGEGETQTDERSAAHPSGATGYHTVKVTVNEG